MCRITLTEGATVTDAANDPAQPVTWELWLRWVGIATVGVGTLGVLAAGLGLAAGVAVRVFRFVAG